MGVSPDPINIFIGIEALYKAVFIDYGSPRSSFTEKIEGKKLINDFLKRISKPDKPLEITAANYKVVSEIIKTFTLNLLPEFTKDTEISPLDESDYRTTDRNKPMILNLFDKKIRVDGYELQDVINKNQSFYIQRLATYLKVSKPINLNRIEIAAKAYLKQQPSDVLVSLWLIQIDQLSYLDTEKYYYDHYVHNLRGFQSPGFSTYEGNLELMHKKVNALSMIRDKQKSNSRIDTPEWQSMVDEVIRQRSSNDGDPAPTESSARKQEIQKAFKILGLDSSNPEKTTPVSVKKAYRKLALIYHPDKGCDPERFRKIQVAYEKLEAVFPPTEQKSQASAPVQTPTTAQSQRARSTSRPVQSPATAGPSGFE